GHALDRRVIAGPLGYGPTFHRTAQFQSEIVVQAACPVLLDHKGARLLVGPAAFGGLRRHLEIAFLAIPLERIGHGLRRLAGAADGGYGRWLAPPWGRCPIRRTGRPICWSRAWRARLSSPSWRRPWWRPWRRTWRRTWPWSWRPSCARRPWPFFRPSGCVAATRSGREHYRHRLASLPGA